MLTPGGWTHPIDSETISVWKKGDAEISLVKSGANAGTWTSMQHGKTTTGKGAVSLGLFLKGMPGPYTNVKAITLPIKTTYTPPAEPYKQPEHVETFKNLQAAYVAPSMTESGAINQYKGSEYESINNCLRYTDNCIDKRVPKIESWLNINSLPHDVTVWRGVRGDYAKILSSIAMVGTKFRDKGFLSTSTNPGFADDWSGGLLLKINAKQGAHAATIKGPDHGSDHEYEVLFQRGSAMTVKSWDPKKKTLEVDLNQD